MIFPSARTGTSRVTAWSLRRLSANVSSVLPENHPTSLWAATCAGVGLPRCGNAPSASEAGAGNADEAEGDDEIELAQRHARAGRQVVKTGARGVGIGLRAYVELGYYAMGGAIGKAAEGVGGAIRGVFGLRKSAAAARVARGAIEFSRYFRENVFRIAGQVPKAGQEAHHVYPLKFEDRFARIFGKEFNINHPQLGTIVESSPHRKWSYEYNQAWSRFFQRKGDRTPQETIQFAQELAKRYGFNWGR